MDLARLAALEPRLHLLAKRSSGGPLSITQLATGEQVTRQAITKHLGVREEAGLVRGARTGRERRWELAPLDTARSCLDLVAQRWGPAPRAPAHPRRGRP